MKLISFDLDMTLLDHAVYKIPDSALLAIAGLKKAGHKIAIASGRDMFNVHGVPFLDIVKPDAVVSLNGCHVVADNTLLFHHIFDPDLKERLFRFCEKKQYSIGLTKGDEDYYINPDYVDEMDRIRWGEIFRNHKDAHEILNMDVHTMIYIGTKEGAMDIAAHFPELNLPFFSGEWGADIVEKTMNKAVGVSKICEYYNISMRDVIAFGDAMNDAQLITQAGLGIAMGNANPKLKELADYVTDDIDKDGVWNACVHFHLLANPDEIEDNL